MGLTSFIQWAIRPGKNQSAIAPRPSPRPASEAVYVCFSIAVYLENGPSDPWPARVTELQAGQRYKVVVTCEHSRNRPDQEDVTINDDFELLVLGQALENAGYEKLRKEFHIAYNEILEPVLVRDWAVTLPEKLPTCDFSFSVNCKVPPFYLKESIASLTLPLKGNTILENTQLLEACNIATGLPENVAVLTITHANQEVPSDQYRIIGHSRLIGNFAFTLQDKSILGIAQLYPRTGIPTILNAIHLFSKYHARLLLEWLSMLRDACAARQQHPCIIAVDTTGKVEIPWELLELEVDEFLGVVAQVVRWQPFTIFGRKATLHVEERVYEGSVLAYLDEVLQAVNQEAEALQSLALERLPTLQELGDRLYQVGSLKHVGLVLISCHGLKGNRLFNENTDELQRPHSELRALHMAQMPRHKDGQRSIFFVNACESGLMLQGDKTNPDNFGESFLTQCADCYIGTTASVDTRRAALIAKRILELAQEEEGVQIAELLRRLREEAVKDLHSYALKNDAQKELFYRKALFYTFMYVYYGNPLARLRLLTATGEKEGA
jgi:hypothetical protein